ncbi:MAG: S-layer homology domain-containing protein [Clostridia bacterium]|nr:S-layer homology domain-containing protein [Clostridia bacterium]
MGSVRKSTVVRRAISLILLVSFLTAAIRIPVFAEPETPTVTVTEGDVVAGFAGEGALCGSSDPSVAWVDSEGNLRALREGETVVTVGDETRKVVVSDYTDGSDVVGQLKILARFNDSMQFYDGHVYLLFTSYKDGVTIAVDDLYAGYEISDLYYLDIRDDISAGSNHTGTDTDKYFTPRDGMNSVTLNRGGIVTIGMYRGFDLSVPEAAFGSVQNSTLWGQMSDAVKTTVMEALFKILAGGASDTATAVERLMKELGENGFDYRGLLDGVVSGGVCFNRELYNQKLEWDQYENVTYELDITENQLRVLTAALRGNLNKFSILKNSCATVALRAWNYAVGMRGGEDTAYKLDPSGEGLFALIDAPKTVKSEIMAKLPGYYLNKPDSSEDEREPNAGFVDETGWVYVSAPEAIELGDGENGMFKYIVTGPSADAETTVYRKGAGGEEIPFPRSEWCEAEPGDEIFVRSILSEDDFDYVFSDVLLNGVSVRDSFDEEENAYRVIMPERKSIISVVYRPAEVRFLEGRQMNIQLAVGSEINVDDYAELLLGMNLSDDLVWKIDSMPPEAEIEDVVSYKDDSRKVLKADAAGTEIVEAVAAGNENIGVPFFIEIYDDLSDMAAVTFNTDTSFGYTVGATFEEDYSEIPCSGYLVRKGTVLNVVPFIFKPAVVSRMTVNGSPANIDDPITVTGDTDIRIEFREAEIAGMPNKVNLASEGDSYQLDASVRYSNGIYGLLPVYDPTVTYESSDPIVSVDETGLLTVTGEIPEEGKCVFVTAYAGSGFGSVFAETKVILGDYAGDRIVGRLTISARPITDGQLVAHTAITFTTYEDLDIDVSYYRYYKPSEEYLRMSDDYLVDPDSYPSDPILYSDDVDLGDREAYFEEVIGGVDAPAETIRLRAGDGFTVSNYAHETSNVATVLKAFTLGMIGSSTDVQNLVAEVMKYANGEEFNGPLAFDSFTATLVQMVMFTSILGQNPANGRAEGGQDINREVYNQFRRNDSQLPNNFYTVELTADEFARFENYIGDPGNNYYALFTKNCGSGGVDLWNYVLSDRPELRLTGNYTGLAVDPESISLELGLLRLKTGVFFDGYGEGGGTDFYPRVSGAFRQVRKQTLVVEADPKSKYAGDDDPELTFTVYDSEGEVVDVPFTGGLEREPGESAGTYAILRGTLEFEGGDYEVIFVGSDFVIETAFPFVDVHPDDYFYAPVAWAFYSDPQITAGTSATKFSPDDVCTRAQVVTFLWRANGCPKAVTEKNPFSDVASDAYYYDAVLWAVENGITAGTSKKKFSPDLPCTRAQVVTFIHRTNGTPRPGSVENPFRDVSEEYYYTAVLWAVENGVTAGTSKTMFSPDDVCTRAQVVTFLQRASNIEG